jgi:toxin CcdB
LESQFDIVENLNIRTRSQYPYLLVLQHERTSSVRARIVAPLTEWTDALANTRIHPTVYIESKRYVALIEHLAAVPRTAFGKTVGSSEPQRYEIVAALDLLFTGV